MPRFDIPGRLFIAQPTFDMPLVNSLGFDAIHKPISLTPHVHPCYEMTYLFSGEVTWVTETGETLRLTGGKMALTQPGVAHRGEFDIITPSAFFWLVFDPTAAQATRHTPFTAAQLQMLDQRLRDVGNAVTPASRDLPLLLHRLYELNAIDPSPGATTQAKTLRAMTIRALLASLVLEIVNTFEDRRDTPPRDDAVSQACAYIEGHLGDALSVHDIAAHVGLSVSRLHALFRRDAGITPADYLQRQRCLAAQNELAETDRSITDIAFSLGFGSSQYFATCFRKYTGQTPGDFRRARQHA